MLPQSLGPALCRHTTPGPHACQGPHLLFCARPTAALIQQKRERHAPSRGQTPQFRLTGCHTTRSSSMGGSQGGTALLSVRPLAITARFLASCVHLSQPLTLDHFDVVLI